MVNNVLDFGFPFLFDEDPDSYLPFLVQDFEFQTSFELTKYLFSKLSSPLILDEFIEDPFLLTFG